MRREPQHQPAGPPATGPLGPLPEARPIDRPRLQQVGDVAQDQGAILEAVFTGAMQDQMQQEVGGAGEAEGVLTLRAGDPA